MGYCCFYIPFIKILHFTILKNSLALGSAAVRRSSNKTISVEVIFAPAFFIASIPI